MKYRLELQRRVGCLVDTEMSGDNVKLFVGNLPLDATHDELTKLFSPFGEINTCSLLRQYAFVTLKGEGAADRAIRNLDGKEYRGRPLVVEESRARPPNSTKVFVGNLAATCSADDLHGLFSTYGRVLDCDKVKARLCSNVGYAFVHMERKEEALVAIEGLNGTNYKGRQLAVELSKAQPLINQLAMAGNNHGGSGRDGLLPRPPPSLEHHQSQAAVLAAAAAAAAGLPIQVQQSVHNSFYNTTTFDPTYAALKGITSANGADGVIYDALASQVYGTVADQVYKDMSNHNSAAVAPVTEADSQNGPDPTTLFEAARAKFFQEGQKVLAEQQIGRKGAENERDRSPIRGNRAPLLPDPVPGSFGQIRQKRRALLPTPPGAPEESPAATNTPEGSDPVARSYEEYYQQLHQYQQYQQYQQQQQYQYLQYAYTNPPPPPPPPPATTQASTTAPAPPGTYSAPPTYAAPGAYPPPGTYDASGGYAAPPGSYDASGGYGPPGAYAAAGSYSTSTPYEQTAAHGQPMPQRHDYPYHTPEPPYR
ncbi:RNA-binding protein 4-like [Gymnodraco acuticeps]|uniref:RNA-binding protein 14 n=1 Tax=Gymnodraco acuticeps TaxID=8218 RepID=A0A6P8TFK1_GYMAC|nr:RNA-binding protein 4-like [Gymnodraco acuticeps]